MRSILDHCASVAMLNDKEDKTEMGDGRWGEND